MPFRHSGLDVLVRQLGALTVVNIGGAIVEYDSLIQAVSERAVEHLAAILPDDRRIQDTWHMSNGSLLYVHQICPSDYRIGA